MSRSASVSDCESEGAGFGAEQGADDDGLADALSIARPLPQHHGSTRFVRGGARPHRAADQSPEPFVDDGAAASPGLAASPSGSAQQQPQHFHGHHGGHGRRGASEAGSTTATDVHSFLTIVPHFCTLRAEQLRGLRVMLREFDALDLVIDENAVVNHIYVLASGTVDVFDFRQHRTAVAHKRIGTISSPNLFGIESVIYDRPSEFVYRASSAATVLLVPRAQFLELLPESPLFAHSIATRLTRNQPVFSVFQNFCRAIFASNGGDNDGLDGYPLQLPAVLESYARMRPIVHSLLESTAIDVTALHYATNRLPENITETFVLTLSRSLPPFVASALQEQRQQARQMPAGSFTTAPGSSASVPFSDGGVSAHSTYGFGSGAASFAAVATANRRRSSWRIGDRGNTLVILRDPVCDLIDIVTALSIHLLESRKIRVRLNSMVGPTALEVLRPAVDVLSATVVDDEAAFQDGVLQKLPLTAAERTGINAIWPTGAVRRLFRILMHQEQLAVRVDSSLSRRFDPDPFLPWGLAARRHVARALGLADVEDLPEDIRVDILVGGSRTTKNLLCSLNDAAIAEIEAAAVDSDVAAVAGDLSLWTNDADRRYFLQHVAAERSEQVRAAVRGQLKRCGFVTVADTTQSGLELCVTDAARIDPAAVDAVLRETVARSQAAARASGTRHFILMADYAFGAQVEGVLRALLLTFGHRIASVTAVGKAAGIVGNRGDVLLPDRLLFSKAALGEDMTDELTLCPQPGVSRERLRQLLGGRRDVHGGVAVTIPGVLLQNSVLLRHYRVLYGAAALEMEAAYCARQINETASLGLIRNDVAARYSFYFQDMPLGNADASPLVGRSKSIDAVTAMYAIQRAMLEAIFMAS